MARWIGLSLLVASCFLPPSAAADDRIRSCRNADGSVQFQDRPCGPTSEVAAETNRRHVRLPAGIHPSWFERPPAQGVEARCDASGCRCGEVRRAFENGFVTAVADALYIDGAWHRLQAKRGTPGAGASSGSAHVVAACDVLISQQTLLRHAETVLREMRSRARDAENRGHHRPAACEAGDAEACAALDDFRLYRRMLADLGTLREARRAAGAPPDTLPLARDVSPAARSSR